MSNEKEDQDKLMELKITKLRLEVWHTAARLTVLLFGGLGTLKLTGLL